MCRTRYARSGDSRIAYELRGTRRWRRPWFVLIQGMGFDRHGWDPVLRNLGRHFRLVLVDNRGSGRSDLPPGSFGVADMAGDILSVLDGAGIRRAHVMGVSPGGMVAQEMAVDYPERVGDLILVSTTPGWPFAYPMPAVSAALIARTGSLTREVAAQPCRERPVCAHGPGPSRSGRPPGRTPGHAVSRPRGAGRPGGRWCWLHRPSTANAHPRTHAGLARICGHRGRSGQRQAARGPHPRRADRDLPGTGPSALLGRPRRFRGHGHLVPARRPCAPERAARREEEALSFDGAAISVSSGLSWNFSVEESGRREAEVSEALITIIIDGHRVGPEEIRWRSNGNHLLLKNGGQRP